MKKQFLKTHYFAIGALALLLTIIYSCKKDGTSSEGDVLAKAKAWYEKTNAKNSATIKTNTALMATIKQNAVWDDAQMITLEDGTQVIGSPLKTTINDGNFENGSFLLLISKNGKKFESRILYSEDNARFGNDKLTTSVLKEWSKLAFNSINKKHLYNISNNAPAGKSLFASTRPIKDKGVMNLKEAGCTDWYLVTSYYDENGYFLYSEEQYLYSSGCTQEGGGGGGGGGDHGTIPVYPWGEAASEFVSTTEQAPEGGDRVLHHKWICLKGPANLYRFYSFEKAVHKLVSGNWQYKSLDHLTITPEGTLTGYNMDLILNYAAPSFLTATAALMHLNVSEHREIVGSGTVVHTYAPAIDTYHEFDIL